MLDACLLVGIVSCLAVVWTWYAWLPFDDEVPKQVAPKFAFEVRTVRFLIHAFPTAAGLFLLLQLVCAVGFMTYLPAEGEWFRPDRRWLWLTCSLGGLGIPILAWMAKIGLQDLRGPSASRPAPTE